MIEQKKIFTVVALGVIAGLLSEASAQPSGGRPGFNPEPFIRRLDRNNDGLLGPEEMQGRARHFLERYTRDNPNLDTSKPIPIEVLMREIRRRREDSQRGERPSDGSGRSSSSSAPEQKPPLVQGFGVDELPPPVPGFGEQAERFSVNVIDTDRDRARDIIRRYDSDGDGQLSRSETARGRWFDDPFDWDRNGDRKLSETELAMRYAERRQNESGSDSRRSDFRSDGRGGSDNQHRDRKSRYSRDRRESDSRENQNKTSYRFSTAHERLPEGLPEWFKDRDQDKDGQIMLHEFTNEFNNAVIAQFQKQDLNGDGVITPGECLAAKAGVQPIASDTTGNSPDKSSGDDRPTRYRFGRKPRGSSPESTRTGSTNAATSPAPEGIDAATFTYFTRYVAKYDEDRDGELSREEWRKMPKDPAAADKDRNGRITVAEYARWKLGT